jgi:ferritin-like metal-binding protein YciE
MTERELFIAWLNDAYSTELAMIPVLENHANDASDYPQIYERQMQHLEETRRQAEQLETMITNLGGKVSIVKSITGKTLGLGKSVSTGMFSDEMIKNFLADYAAEHLEIASYKSLIATAQHLGENQCLPVLEGILAEEEAMAAWLKQHIPMATVESLKIAASDADGGKRSKKSSGKKGVVAKMLKPSGLVTLLGVGAVAAGAAMILRAPQNKNDNSESNQSTLSIEGNNEYSESSLAKGNSGDVGQVDVIISETLIVDDEPELIITRASGVENL